jgi:hypothetical protein
VENKVDFADPRNLITTAVALTAGAGDLTLKFRGRHRHRDLRRHHPLSDSGL